MNLNISNSLLDLCLGDSDKKEIVVLSYFPYNKISFLWAYMPDLSFNIPKWSFTMPH